MTRETPILPIAVRVDPNKVRELVQGALQGMSTATVNPTAAETFSACLTLVGQVIDLVKDSHPAALPSIIRGLNVLMLKASIDDRRES